MYRRKQWWEERYGFFGEFYLDGDNSKEGCLAEKRSLRERTTKEVAGVINILNLKGGEKILDDPCGYGRHSIELARRVFTVIGSDINSIHLKVAIAESQKLGISVDFCKENMLEINYSEEFDAVINMFYSFGFFETDEENMKVLKNFHRALKPGGKFLMHTDVNIPRIIAGKYKEDEIRNLSSGNNLRIIDHFNPTTKRIEGVWIITKLGGREIRKNYSVRVYEKDEFIQMCLEVGFKKCEAYGSWEGDSYSEDGEEIMFVATK